MKNIYYAGLTLLLFGLLGLFALDLPLRDHRSLTLTSPEGTSLSATYYPGSVSKGILILPGFGSDQHMMRSIIRDMTASGLHVFIFDYSGHGSSSGSLEYDNASTDRLAGQVQIAMSEFQDISGLDASQIVWMGHSLGARVALQSAVLGPIVPSKLVLVGAQVNLGTNAQSEFFTGTTDNELEWVRSLGPDAPPVPILLLSGAWEDILTVEAAQLLMTKLCGQETALCASGSHREWILFDNLFHNYEAYSPRVITSAREWAFPDVSQPTSLASLRLGLWLSVVLGMILSIIGLSKMLTGRKAGNNPLSGFSIDNPKKFVWAKLWLWLIALPLSGMIMYLYVLIPLPGPTFNLIYGGFLGGYGLLMFLLHWCGRMPGASGRFRQVQTNAQPMDRGWFFALLFNLVLFIAVSLLYRSGIGLVPPVGVRFGWMLIFTPLTALGLWVGFIEADALSVSSPGKPLYRILSILIGLLPFYLYIIMLVSLSSISGVLASMVGLLILGISFLQGEITRNLTGNYIVSAILQALLIFWLILPAGPLFAPLF